MKTQNVMTQGIQFVVGSAGSINSKGSKGNDFNLMMDQNLKSLQSPNAFTHSSSKKIMVQKLDKNKPEDGNEGVTDTLSGGNDQTKSIGTANGNRSESLSSSTDNTVMQNQTDAMDPVDKESDAVKELLAQIVAMLQSIQEVVMQQLNLTSEDLDQLLSEQGMSLTDLLQPDQLQQLVLASNGQTDISAVLTDENLAATMNDLMNSMEAVKADANIGLSDEQLQKILMQASAKGDLADSILASGLQEQLSQAANLSGQADISANVDPKSNSEEITQKLNSGSQNDQAATVTNTTASAKEGLDNNQDNAREQDQSDLKATEQFQNFVDNLVKNTQDQQVNFNGNLSQATELRDIANQILDRIRLSVSTNQASMELQLNPEHLGKVNLTVQSKNGIMTAQFTVQNELSKEAIESQLHVLRETLHTQGVKVEAIEVSVSAYAFDQNTNQEAGNHQETKKSNSGKKITLEEALAMSEDMDDSSMITGEAIGMSGSQIDYTA